MVADPRVVDPLKLIVPVLSAVPSTAATNVPVPKVRTELVSRVMLVASILLLLVAKFRVREAAMVIRANDLGLVPKLPLEVKLLANVTVPTPSVAPITLPVIVVVPLTARVELAPKVVVVAVMLLDAAVRVLAAAIVTRLRV